MGHDGHGVMVNSCMRFYIGHGIAQGECHGVYLGQNLYAYSCSLCKHSRLGRMII